MVVLLVFAVYKGAPGVPGAAWDCCVSAWEACGLWAIAGASFILAALGYNLFLRFCVRGRAVAVCTELWKERILDFIAGHRRYRVIKRFPTYCLSCEQMLERAAADMRGRGGAQVMRAGGEAPVMRTVQTPVEFGRPKTNGNGDPEKNADWVAYQRYIATTYRMVLLNNWEYKRLVYLDVSDPTGLRRAFARSYGFARGYAFDYCFGPLTVRKNWQPGMPPHRRYGKPLPNVLLRRGAVWIAYMSRKEGLLDVVSRLDLHMPPGQEFSIAFVNNAGDAAGNGADKFVGCVRVSEPERGMWPLRGAGLNGEVKEAIGEVFDNEWRTISLKAIALISNLPTINVLNESKNAPGGLHPMPHFAPLGLGEEQTLELSEKTVAEILYAWETARFDTVIFEHLVLPAVVALHVSPNGLPAGTTAETWVKHAAEGVAEELGIAVGCNVAVTAEKIRAAVAELPV